MIFNAKKCFLDIVTKPFISCHNTFFLKTKKKLQEKKILGSRKKKQARRGLKKLAVSEILFIHYIAR